ncbi:MAG: hypothetical protein WAX44_03210 [Minisyncoccia bacterium]
MSPKNVFEYPEFNEEEPEIIEVNQTDKWKLIESGQFGATTGLGPCVGVILYDPDTKRAFVGHFIDPRIKYFEDMLTEAKKLFGDLKKVKVYVGGGAFNPDDAPDFTDDKEIRRFVEDKLAENGFQDLKINYHNSTDSTVLSIDTKTGNVEYDTRSDFGNEE